MASLSPKQTKPDSRRPALRLIKTNELSREEWLEVRKNGIGSSDAAAAVGLNPYQSQLELWMVKTGRDTRLPKDDPNDDSSPLFWGTMLESFVAAAYTRRTGNRVRKLNSVLRHAEHPWMLANIDREVMGVPTVQILECKTTGMNGQRLWRDGVPEYIELQVQHQLAVTGKLAADVAVLVCGNDFRTYRIQRDDKMIRSLIELEKRFWHYVETDTPPPTDGSDSAARALQALYPEDNTSILQLEDDAEMNAVFSDLLAVRQSIAASEEFEAKLKQRIQERMGNAGKAIFSAGEVTWKKSLDGVVLDVATLLRDQPELLHQYPLERRGSRRFLVAS